MMAMLNYGADKISKSNKNMNKDDALSENMNTENENDNIDSTEDEFTDEQLDKELDAFIVAPKTSAAQAPNRSKSLSCQGANKGIVQNFEFLATAPQNFGDTNGWRRHLETLVFLFDLLLC